MPKIKTRPKRKASPVGASRVSSKSKPKAIGTTKARSTTWTAVTERQAKEGLAKSRVVLLKELQSAENHSLVFGLTISLPWPLRAGSYRATINGVEIGTYQFPGTTLAVPATLGLDLAT